MPEEDISLWVLGFQALALLVTVVGALRAIAAEKTTRHLEQSVARDLRKIAAVARKQMKRSDSHFERQARIMLFELRRKEISKLEILLQEALGVGSPPTKVALAIAGVPDSFSFPEK